MERNGFKIHAENIIEVRLGKSGPQFRNSHKNKLKTGTFTFNKADLHWLVLKVAFYHTLGALDSYFIDNNFWCRMIELTLE